MLRVRQEATINYVRPERPDHPIRIKAFVRPTDNVQVVALDTLKRELDAPKGTKITSVELGELVLIEL